MNYIKKGKPMIPKSTAYKLVRKNDNIVVAEGSAKTIRSLQKNTPATYIVLTDIKVGEKFVFTPIDEDLYDLYLQRK